MRYHELMEGAGNGLLYRWVDVKTLLKNMATDSMLARHVHWIEDAGRLVRGLSTSLDPHQWMRRAPICFVLDRSKISNRQFEINGQATYELTNLIKDWKTSAPDYRQQYRYEELKHKIKVAPHDEVFIKGDVHPLHLCCHEIIIRDAGRPEFKDVEAVVRDYATRFDIPVQASDVGIKTPGQMISYSGRGAFG